MLGGGGSLNLISCCRMEFLLSVFKGGVDSATSSLVDDAPADIAFHNSPPLETFFCPPRRKLLRATPPPRVPPATTFSAEASPILRLQSTRCWHQLQPGAQKLPPRKLSFRCNPLPQKQSRRAVLCSICPSWVSDADGNTFFHGLV